MLDSVFDAFVTKSPVTVMARGMMERAFNSEKLNNLTVQSFRAVMPPKRRHQPLSFCSLT
jgi:hypothetical protein